jgi:hypothetical protein
MSDKYLLNNTTLRSGLSFEPGDLIEDLDLQEDLISSGGVLVEPTSTLVGASSIVATLFPKGQRGSEAADIMNAAYTAGVADHRSALEQAVWYIDPVDGDDNNTGLTADTALETHAEFERRIGHYNTFVPQVVDIHILNDLPSSDPINLMLKTKGSQQINYHGESCRLQTPLFSGTFSSVTVMDPSTNQATLGVADGLGDLICGRVRVPELTDAIAWVAKDLGGVDENPAGTVRLSNLTTVPVFTAGDGANVTPMVPVIGMAFVVDPLRKAHHGAISLIHEGNDVGPADANNPVSGEEALATLQFLDFEWQTNSSGFFYPFLLASEGSDDVPVVKYLANRLLSTSEQRGGYCELLNCCATAGVAVASSDFVVQAGLYMDQAEGLGFAFILGVGTQHFVDFHTLVQGTGVLIQGGGWARIAEMAVFDSTADAFVLNQGAMLRNTSLSENALLWGSGNVGDGVVINAGAQLFYETTPIVTGTAGDFSFAGVHLGQPYDATAGAYVAPATATTWSNLAGATNGDFHHPTTNAHAILLS